MIPNYNYSTPDTYPEIDNASPNPDIVNMLQNLYADSHSELNAIMQYSYQHFLLHKLNPDIAHVLNEINIVEMHHLELLAEAIMAFGGTPQFVNDRKHQYCTNSVFYCTNLLNMLQKDINDELQAIEQYTSVAKKVNNSSLQNLLFRIADDEKMHAEILQQIYNNEAKHCGNYDNNNIECPKENNCHDSNYLYNHQTRKSLEQKTPLLFGEDNSKQSDYIENFKNDNNHISNSSHNTNIVNSVFNMPEKASNTNDMKSNNNKAFNNINNQITNQSHTPTLFGE